jgi:hypothetical protein
MDVSLPFSREFLSMACLLLGTVMTSKAALKGRINGFQCFIGIVGFFIMWFIVVQTAYECVGRWMLDFTGSRVPELVSLIWWPTELAIAPLVMTLYLTLMSGVVLFSFVGSDDDDEDEMRAHRRAVFAVAQWLNWRLLGCLAGYWVLSRVIRYIVLPRFGIVL